ncbi:ATP-grasp domain-containing protein [bacterium SCSIO 12696]|uniref:ATP-grasp domain-containing protein n=1 Tax=Porticoccus sp. W117 TaxID=3054777 RepID=UPI00220B7485|nr:ATP-grasp domain-containing protein [Porticoccus sp. W117]MDM3872380.1 ATP-grasp domain-containing protein [Porticoccus sp. W117]UTW46025.1 ATP-grasp domain-containing protein [bacterium SCSIO 12696]
MPESKISSMRVLVSGASGDIGLGIGRILKEDTSGKVFGCDITPDGIGKCVFDDMFSVPRADDASYIESIEALISENNIEVFIPTSEAEISVLSNSGVDFGRRAGCHVVMANATVVNVSLDKYATARFVEKNGLNSPWTSLVEVSAPQALPCIFKPRGGRGSKDVEVVKTEERARELSGRPDYIWQELLLPDDQEYTCGLYVTASGEVRSVIFKRSLSGGLTGKGEVVENDEIRLYLEKLAERLGLVGAINVQLRLTSRGPVLFEINPRFSSTVVFRHKLGFKDLIWSLEELAGMELDDYAPPKNGIKFYRGYAEYIED